MKLSANLFYFVQVFGVHKTLDIFSAAGFQAVDFNHDIEEFYDDSHDKAYYLDLRKYAEDRGLAISQAHAPFASAFADREKSEKRFHEIVRSFRHASWLGVEQIVVHPTGHIQDEKECLDYNIDFYHRLRPYAEDAGLQIAVENIPGTPTQTPEGLLRVMDALSGPAFTICFDVGHAQISHENPAEFIRKIPGRIGCTHIHDNNGTADQHLLPYYGVLQWDEIMKALAETDYQGNLSYEAGCFAAGLPLELRPAAAVFMAQVGGHLREMFWGYKGK